jgi:dTDP-glucose 4,6-dehydratase
MKRTFHAILVTGGAGFIGSHVIRTLLKNHADAKIVNLDLLTYAGNLENLRDLETQYAATHLSKATSKIELLIEALFERTQV